MIKGFDASLDRFLADVSRIEERQARAERRISSGLRVSRPSDAPENVINIVELRASIDRATGIGTNLQRVKTEVDSAEAAVRVSIQLVERARVLAAQAATSTALNRQSSAVEVRQIHDQLVSLTRTVSEGRYVFSGDLDTTVLYEADWTQPGGIRRLSEATNTRLIEDINGTDFSVGRSAHEIFDARDSSDAPAAHNVFEAVHALGVALENDDQTGAEDAGIRISAALDHLNRQVTFYGNAQNRVATAADLAQKAILSRTQELSSAQDADITEALATLNMARVHHEAALGAHAQMPKTTLFDYLG